MSLCANCGKGEEVGSDLKTCTACKSVKYCSRDCQIAHRPQHKKECKKRAKELHDEKLFKQPPPKEDCPICMIRLPILESGRMFMACCGKMICIGCIHAPVYDDQGNEVVEKACAFCRSPVSTSITDDQELIRQFEKRTELNDSYAIYSMGCKYAEGMLGLPQDYGKALEQWHQAAGLGNSEAYYNIGIAYDNGDGVERDETKAAYYYELAAIRGDPYARANLGVKSLQKGNMDRALKHFMIAARDGGHDSLKNIKLFYSHGCTTKDDYAKALRSYQAYLDEIKSEQRDNAAAFHDAYKYYESAV